MDYRQVKAINNSLMSVYEDNYLQFIANWVNNVPIPDKSDNSLTLGTLIDVLITANETYNDKFIIYDGDVPTGQVLKFCELLAKKCKDPDLAHLYYDQIYDEIEIKSPVLAKFISTKFEPAEEYYKFLLRNNDKKTISNKQDSIAKQKYDELQQNPYTARFINVKNSDTVEVHNQLELYYKYKSLPIKGALDRVLISHEKKIVQPIDFKTSHNIGDFKHSYYEYKYYRQASFYNYLLKQWMIEKGISDYEIKPFIFVVCSTTSTSHWCYKVSQNDLEMAENGGYTYFGKYIKGWKQILDEIDYNSAVSWQFPYECLINNGIVELNLFSINPGII